MESFFLRIVKSDAPITPHEAVVNQEGCYYDVNSACLIVSDSRIDYKEELAGKLGIKWDVAGAFSDSKLITLAYLKWGTTCLAHLYGDFSFAVWDPRTKELLCARDHLGVRPFYYVDQPGFLAIASHISAFKAMPEFKLEIREQYVLDAICSIEPGGIQSPYHGVYKLKPAHYVKLSRGQLSDQMRYWDLKINETHAGLSLEEATKGLRDRIFDAVGQRSQSPGQMGVELSGGLDSSGIASVLTEQSVQNAKINAFTHSSFSNGTGQDNHPAGEIEFSDALVEKNWAIRHFKISGEDAAGGYDAMVKALQELKRPINLHYALNSDLLFEEAANADTSVIFSGLGGDEGVSFNGSGYLNELIRKGQHSTLRKLLKSKVDQSGGDFYRQLIKHYLKYLAPWFENLYKKDWRKASYSSFALQKSLARKYRMKKRYFHSSSLPLKADLRATQYFRIMYPNIPERIEETSLLARQHGIEYRYPFLDVQLLEFFYSLPSEYKLKDGLGRYLFRMAMKDILPEKIRLRSDKAGNTIPNVFDRVLKDEKRFRDTIEDGRLQNQFHYVDYDKLHEMLDSFKKLKPQKAGKYGLREFQSAISVLILQQWQREGKINIGIKY